VQALTAYQASLDPTTHRPFPQGGIVIDIPDTVKIVLAGDWGTNCDPATGPIRDLMLAEAAAYTIHVGDTYYSGSPAENDAFAAMWPAGSMGSFNLTSNHDMYSALTGYLQTLADPKFEAQGGKLYFALRNANWLVIGLDSASHSTDFLYKEGVLDQRQLGWLNGLIAEDERRGVILLSHHDGFNLEALDAEPQEPRPKGIIYKSLWSQVTRPAGRPFRWFWGHVHAPYVASNGCRCIGHGGIPYLPFPDFYSDFGDEAVRILWAETATAKTGNPLRAPNGFAVLRLDGPAITEQLIDEGGRAVWQA
jgi:hypothetical protein